MACCYDDHDPKDRCTAPGDLAGPRPQDVLPAIRAEWGHDPAYCDKIIARALVEHEAALRGLVEIIEAAGLQRLAFDGVALGAASWYAKASDRLSYAKDVLGIRPRSNGPGDADGDGG